MKTVCLNMIVKNERLVIERCLSSLKPIIDYWVIVDTGSTDGTQSIILEFLKEIPGELHERPWVDFGCNRNEALDLARYKGDYLLFIDADERLVFLEPFEKAKLDKDYYLGRMIGLNVDFKRILFVKNGPDWSWSGVIHEFITNPLPVLGEVLTGVINEYNHVKGSRSRDPEKGLKDAILLQEALEKDPTNSRYVFYLAQSYLSAGQLDRALSQFEKRISLGEGNTPMSREEVFWSLFNAGILQSDLKFSPELAIDTLLRAHHFDEERAEPLYRLAIQFQFLECHILAYLLIQEAISLPRPKFYIRLLHPIYDYLLLLKLAEFAFLIGNKEESKEAYEKLLEVKNLPMEMRELAENNWMKLNTYQEQASLEGSPEETFWSLYCIGCQEEDLGFLPIAAYSRAFEFDKKRVEPLYRLARFLENRPYLCYLVAKYARSLPPPQTADLSQSSIYRDLDFKFAESAYKIGHLDEAYRAYEELLEKNPSEEERVTLEENLRKLSFLLSKTDKTGSPLYRPLSAEASRPLEL